MPRSPGTPCSTARSGRSPYLAEALSERGRLTGEDVAAAVAAGDAAAVQMIRDGGRRVGQVIAGLVELHQPRTR